MLIGFLLLLMFVLLSWLVYNNIPLALLVATASIVYIFIAISEGTELSANTHKKKH